MLEGRFTELGPGAWARALAVNRTRRNTITWANAPQNCWCRLRLPLMASPQYFLSPVFSGVPVSSKYALAHTRPSVVSLQFAGGFDALTSMHFFLISKSTALC